MLLMRRFFTFLFILFCCAAQAQNVAVHGAVTDSSNSPLIAATVKLQVLSDSTISQTVTTDSKGEYHFYVVASGNYQLRISFVGFKDFQKVR